MDAVQHATVRMLRRALHESLVQPIVATVAQAGALHILAVAVYRVLARGSP